MTLTSSERDLLIIAVELARAYIGTDKGRQQISDAALVVLNATITPDPDLNISPELQAHIRDWRLRQDRRLPV
jgi:hypothetical protein